MLRIIQNNTPAGAKSYYSTADYYAEGQELVGLWRGDAAARLGLSGKVQQADWDALCDNLNPATGEALTPRRRADRRVGYDFNFHVPKSVSTLYGLTRDERILDAFRESVGETMHDMESEMQARVRADGRNEDRTTGNMVWGEFVHFTARPVNGIPDPHLHAHCFVFNATWDHDESRWKAGQFAGLKRDAPYFEAVFHSRLARRLQELGLPTVRTRSGWEIAGIPDTAIQRFSRRTALIEDAAREAGVTDPEAKGELGAKTRERKARNLTLDELRREWRDRLEPAEAAALALRAGHIGEESYPEQPAAAREAADQAIGHCFERSAVVPERRLLADAMKRAVGIASPETVTQAVAKRGLIIAERDGRRLATTREVLAEESRMLAFARNGRGTCRPLAPEHAIHREWLNDAQRKAVRHVLESRDRVILVRGAAGTGKTSMMQEAAEGIESTGTRVFTFAPSADASRGVLRQEGFDGADTVSRLLVDERLQAEIRGQVIWIDEAGLLSSRMMAKVFDLAGKLDVRVVLSGDRRQHGSVERGAALRLLEEEAGIRPAELRDIQRQRGDYKAAVAALGDGRTDEGFRRLDQLGWIREVGDTDRYRVLAEDYAAIVKQGKTALVVSPTHLEGEWITGEIRERLRHAGTLRGGDRSFTVLESTNLTEADRRDELNYSPGGVLVFHQNTKGHRKGDRVAVGDAPLPLDQAARFQLFRTGELSLTAGDRIRITRNGTTLDGKHRLNNGAIYEIKRFDAKGNIVLANNWVVSREYGHLAHGYCTTSHASQGKTVDRVLIGQSSDSLPASSREQFYVSVSRGREQATIYTDDREALLAAVDRSDDRMTATELVAGRLRREPYRSPETAPHRPAGREEMSHER
ncbi:MAG: relaxase domain-containing protein [Phycisphaerales bacterium]|nr:relaxase domain-containing protein [Phycisphaerales bacterium]